MKSFWINFRKLLCYAHFWQGENTQVAHQQNHFNKKKHHFLIKYSSQRFFHNQKSFGNSNHQKITPNCKYSSFMRYWTKSSNLKAKPFIFISQGEQNQIILLPQSSKGISKKRLFQKKSGVDTWGVKDTISLGQRGGVLKNDLIIKNN